MIRNPIDDVVSRRLYNQRISSTAQSEPGAVVAWMGAVQAQDYDAARWAIGVRCGADVTAIEAAVAPPGAVPPEIVRTWLLRGTLHFVAAQDVRWMLALLSPRIIANSARRYRQLGLDDDTLTKCCDVFEAALHDCGQLTRNEMFQAAERAGISTKGQRGYHMLRYAGLRATLCYGPQQGKLETFVLLDEQTRGAKGLVEDEAAIELACRYFGSHGPATLKDLVWWSGMRMTYVRSAVERAGRRLKRSAYGDQVQWSSRENVVHDGAPSPSVFLLPAYDEYYLGYADRTAIIDPAYDSRRVSNSGVFRPTIVIDGQIAGVWKRIRKGSAFAITLEPFREFTPAEMDSLLDAADRYGKYLGRPVTLA